MGLRPLFFYDWNKAGKEEISAKMETYWQNYVTVLPTDEIIKRVAETRGGLHVFENRTNSTAYLVYSSKEIALVDSNCNLFWYENEEDYFANAIHTDQVHEDWEYEFDRMNCPRFLVSPVLVGTDVNYYVHKTRQPEVLVLFTRGNDGYHNEGELIKCAKGMDNDMKEKMISVCHKALRNHIYKKIQHRNKFRGQTYNSQN